VQDVSGLIYVQKVFTAIFMLPSETIYPNAGTNLAELLDRVESDRIVVIKRQDGRNIASIAEDELNSLLETVYLLRSSANAKRLFEALEWSKTRDGYPVEPKNTQQAIEELKQELEIGQEKESQSTNSAA
jgi:antitoxin YefM